MLFVRNDIRNTERQDATTLQILQRDPRGSPDLLRISAACLGMRIAYGHPAGTMLTSSSPRLQGADMSEERFDRIEERLDRLEHGQGAIRAEIGELRDGQDELRRHMGVLHEEVMDRLNVLTFDPEPLQREFRAADDALREEIGRRLDPIEAAFRSRRTEQDG